jgi:hypothetical protein
MEAAESLDQYQEALDTVEAHLRFMTQRPLAETLTGLTDFERAKLKTVLAYAITTLQLCYLRSKGESIRDHKNMRHLERLKAFFTRIDRHIDLAAT